MVPFVEIVIVPIPEQPSGRIENSTSPVAAILNEDPVTPPVAKIPAPVMVAVTESVAVLAFEAFRTPTSS